MLRLPIWVLFSLLLIGGWQPIAFAQEADSTPKTRAEMLKQAREERQKDLTPYKISEAEEKSLWWEQWRFKGYSKGLKGFRPLIGGMDDPAVLGRVSSGAGFVFGLGYQYGLDRKDFRFRIDARYSTRKYESIQGRADFPTPRSNSPVQGFVTASYRDYKSLNFYGLGPNSRLQDQSTFRYEDRRFGVGVDILPKKPFFVVAGWGLINSSVYSGERAPSVEDVFDPEDFPPLEVIGILDPPQYSLWAGGFGFNLFDREFPEVGAGFLVEVRRFDDIGDGLFDFTKVEAEFSTEFPLGPRSRRIAFKFRTAHHMPDSGDEVPFYMLEGLGGGTTLRGFRDYRFRDRRSLLMNLEYRWEAWTYSDLILFADAGKVFRNTSEFDFHNLEFGWGGGFMIRTPYEGRLGRYGRFRIDIAKSRDGWQFYIGSGPEFGRRHPPRLQ